MSYAKGLEGVVVDETKVSNVEGEIGRLTYRGYPIEALVSQDYVTVMWLVLFGDLPSDGQRLSLETYLSLHGSLSDSDVNLLRSLQSTLHPMAMLQGMIPLLQMSDVNFSSLDSDTSRGIADSCQNPDFNRLLPSNSGRTATHRVSTRDVLSGKFPNDVQWPSCRGAEYRSVEGCPDIAARAQF